MSKKREFAAWQELHIWLIQERRVAQAKSLAMPDHAGFRGEIVGLRMALKKVNELKWRLQGGKP